jgi:hypothetical protein
MAGKSFVAQIDSWVAATQQRQLAVFRTAAQMVIAQVDTTCPVDVGFLQASRQVLLNQAAPPAINRRSGKSSPAGPPPSFAATLANATLNDRITVAYTAEYAPMVEFGTSRMAPRAWVRAAVSNWPVYVALATAKAKIAAGAA